MKWADVDKFWIRDDEDEMYTGYVLRTGFKVTIVENGETFDTNYMQIIKEDGNPVVFVFQTVEDIVSPVNIEITDTAENTELPIKLYEITEVIL